MGADRLEAEGLGPAPRGSPLVATWPRWAAGTAALTLAMLGAAQAFRVYTHSARTLGSFAGLVGATALVGGLLLVALLRAEESRLSRELRTARTGTPVLRAMLLRRRQQAPLLGRIFSTRVGTAAVLLAEGDRSGAIDALAAGSPLMAGGRLEALRAVVDADADRATGTPGALERCLQRLRAAAPLGHREADLYRLHVRVKALLQLGDAEAALELGSELDRSADEEERVYLAWLRAWFGLDAEGGEPAGGGEWTPLGEGELRVAALLARAQGADKLVEELEGRVAAVARERPPQ